ncbi:MAG: hypothetical protein EHM31_01685 [Candidatus Aminicenantes bacterium]|nr:MAG: hypothetical protein EHM31_06800 [Candidatus Aminicenantes bacterium]RPJ03185.1 MAG: hypothetical protein EHM31_01685 [Candidatus Aminicenantes bacterium]
MASRTARLAAAAALLALVGGSALAAAQTAEASKPLVRKDLLVFGKGEIAPPARDIFRPRVAASASAVRKPGPAIKPTAVAPVPDAPPAFALNISYVGSIKSGGRTIALVLRGGQTLSVSEGDEVAPGYKVVRVTAEAIVVRGPTGETKTFAKQGDRP